MSSALPIVREATEHDLEAFFTFANEAGPGITSLPRDRAFLAEQLQHPEKYFFCLEVEGQVIGTSGIVTRVGHDDPFFAYHLIQEKFDSKTLDIERTIPVLHLIEARKKPTEIGTLYIQKEYRKHGFGPLLSLARFMFLAQNRARFADTVIAEMRGVNQNGISPFWESVGRPFFGCDFSEADYLRITHPEIIQELFPRHPIYTNLLSSHAQEVIGVPHERTVPALRMLARQGFYQSEYVDIFDAGPHYYAPTDEIDVVKSCRKASFRGVQNSFDASEEVFITTTSDGFRATRAPLKIVEESAFLPREVSEALDLTPGDTIYFY